MYEAYYGLSRRPFSTLPNTDQYFAAQAIEGARQNLLRCIQRGEGAGMVIGPIGTGKTLLCNLLAEQLRDQFRVAALLRGGLSTRRALLQAILYELCQSYRGMDEGELRLALSDYVTLSEECPQGMLLIIDEAHSLPIRLLDEIRLLTNLAYQGQPRVRLVLAGGPGLEERFATPKLDSFSQRIAVRCYLEAFRGDETREYIHKQLSSAGGHAVEIFSNEACQSVHRASDGVPRLVNQLCDHALLLAYVAGKRRIDPSCVEEAWADLQQLPTPWNAEAKPQSNASVVEFGGLDDEPAPAPGTESPDTLPLLRVTDSEEEPAAESVAAGSMEQLDRIEDALSELDEDFQPAGTIGPEVELVFADPNNPFSEPFEEEEIVVDHSRQTEGQPEVPAGLPSETPPLRREFLVAPTPMAAASAAAEAATASEPSEGASPQRSAACETMPLRRETAPGEFAPDDSDMIIVEDGYEDPHAPVPRPATAIRRQEYRRLFAKLRYGR